MPNPVNPPAPPPYRVVKTSETVDAKYDPHGCYFSILNPDGSVLYNDYDDSNEADLVAIGANIGYRAGVKALTEENERLRAALEEAKIVADNYASLYKSYFNDGPPLSVAAFRGACAALAPQGKT